MIFIFFIFDSATDIVQTFKPYKNCCIKCCTIINFEEKVDLFFLQKAKLHLHAVFILHRSDKN